MYIDSIELENFRTYKKLNINFCDNINIIYGDNGEGKTNILEAVFLCSMGKSFRTSKDSDLIKFDDNYLKAKISYKKIDRTGSIECNIDSKKFFYLNRC